MRPTPALFALAIPLTATLIPFPNLAQRVESSGVIVVATLTHGTVSYRGNQASSDFILHIDRVLKGDLIPGTLVAAHLEGSRLFSDPGPKSAAIPPSFGIWFLSPAAGPYAVIPVHESLGEPHMAYVHLAKEAPAGEEDF
ncbi:MAG TPA: hypothetical protein VK752_04565 [Bryobacteraceae bacterium]|jgi:hypothetical protein|nr:hypothetical protein [Bryobacteraceae bacterium]